MDRRSFLTAKMPKTITPIKHNTYQGARVLSGLLPYSGPWTSSEITHLLRRTMFGAKKEDVDFFTGMTMDAIIDYLLNVPTSQPVPPLKTYNNSNTPGDPDAAIAQGTTWVNTNTTDGGINAQRRQNFKAWWMGLMISQERNIREKMVMFWHNHFATETTDIGRAIWCYQNNLTLRTHALGNFKTFVKAITLDTGMLRYLNGYLNTKTAPDENYARELQELFTVGKGIDGATSPYSEDDVKAAAKVLTGWNVDGANNITIFNTNRHDVTNKTFSAFYGNTIITGQAGNNGGNLELDALLDMIFATPDVALNICRKLYRWFVYYNIDAAAETNVIEPLATIFRNSGYDIKTTLATLFKSEHFFDSLNKGCNIKNPIDNIVAICREFSIQFPVDTDVTGNYFMWQYVQGVGSGLQQNIGDPPAVAGWPAYYQRPQFHEIWINSDTLPKRQQFADVMNSTGYTRQGRKIIIDHSIFAKSMPNPGDPNALIEDSVKYLLGLPLIQSSRDQIKSDILLTGQISDGYWTSAWNTFISNPGDMMNTTVVKTRLANLYMYLMRLPEYQLS